MEPDRLQITLLKLAEQIHQKETEMARLSFELEELHAKVDKLDQAKIILAEMGDAGEMGLPRTHWNSLTGAARSSGSTTISLREEVQKCLNEHDGGFYAAEVRNWLKQHNYPVTNERNFSAAVHMTLKRLTEQRLAYVVEDETGKRYISTQFNDLTDLL